MRAHRLFFGRVQQTFFEYSCPRRPHTTLVLGPMHSVVSYNVLCSHLASPVQFPACSPAHLAAAARLPKVLAKLAPHVSTGAVLCEAHHPLHPEHTSTPLSGLQEISASWLGELQAFLAGHEYQMLSANYGTAANDYMGVVLAYPRAKYVLASATSRRVARDPTPAWPGFCRWSACDVAREVSRRNNVALFARLLPAASPGGPFCVATYHMPCAYYLPPVMAAHAALVAQARTPSHHHLSPIYSPSSAVGAGAGGGRPAGPGRRL